VIGESLFGSLDDLAARVPDGAKLAVPGQRQE
jgi:hypothetical protein